jgi:hypothetical protein
MRSPARSDDSSNDEETPLLSAQSDDTPLKPSPFPTIQISVLVLPWIAETVMTYSISPYINQVGVADGTFVRQYIGVDLYFSLLGTFRS